MTAHFKGIEELIACAEKIIENLTRLFPNEDPEKIKLEVLLYLLNNSKIEHE